MINLGKHSKGEKIMKAFTMIGLVCCLALRAAAAESDWMTDLPKAEAKAKAEKKLVLVVVDFPRKKEQSEELKKSNDELKDKFKIEGFPTVIVLDGEGKQLS